MTRQQKMMQIAIDHVRSVPAGDKDKYGGLCHNFPVMIRQCGLCQAVAFLASKNEQAHQLILQHAQEQLGIVPQQNAASFARTISGWNATTYALKTRLIMQALVFYKRFAESILDVDAAGAGAALETQTEAEADAGGSQ